MWMRDNLADGPTSSKSVFPTGLAGRTLRRAYQARSVWYDQNWLVVDRLPVHYRPNGTVEWLSRTTECKDHIHISSNCYK